MFKKFVVLLLLVCAIAGMSTVSAHNYNFNGKIGDVYNFDTYNPNGLSYNTGNLTFAFSQSGLFSPLKEIRTWDRRYDSFSTYYEFTAIKVGDARVTIPIPGNSPNVFNFNITE